MPIYEYRCHDCEQIFEEWQKDFEDREIPCPMCGAESKRLISNTAFVLKGGGWYADLYSKDKGSGSSATSNSTGASSCTASEGSSGAAEKSAPAAAPAAPAAPAAAAPAAAGSSS